MENEEKILEGMSEIFGLLEEMKERLDQIPDKEDVEKVLKYMARGQEQKYNSPEHDMPSFEDYVSGIQEIMK